MIRRTPACLFGHGLLDVSAGPQLECLVHVFIVTGHKDDVDLRVPLLELLGNVNPRQSTHLDVKKGNVTRVFPCIFKKSSRVFK